MSNEAKATDEIQDYTIAPQAENAGRRDGTHNHPLSPPLVAGRDLAFAEYVALKAEDLVTQKATRRENRRLALLSVGALVLGFLGVTSVTGTVEAAASNQVRIAESRTNALLAATEVRITKHAEATAITATSNQLERIVGDIQERIHGLEKSVSSERKYFQWSNSIDRLSDPDVNGFSDDERDAALSLFSALVTEADVTAPEFVSTLASMCSVFARADQVEQLHYVESIVPESVWRERTAGDLCYTMLQFFGRLALSSAAPEKHVPALVRFLKYARLHELEPEAHAYEALLIFSQGTEGHQDKVIRFLNDAAAMSPVDAAEFIDRLDIYSQASKFTRSEDAESDRLVQLLADFRLKYQAEIAEVVARAAE